MTFLITLIALIFPTTEIRLNQETIVVELAKTEREQKQGLMERALLGENEGMLFIYPKPQILSFWMKDTLIPLSIAFFGEDRRLINIEDMNPPRKGPLVLYKSKKKACYALEMNQGWFQRHHIALGDLFEWNSPFENPSKTVE